ncbi:anti-sigma factor [Comamonas testosteroni]|uniref:Anti-sigma factor n=1 Tax=Comamonas testosteroni TaxID=285 RepID=A0A373FRR0_COMTE|nr:sigma-E factor negative regulatory protein [Comamonas testosteroni]RGE46844.1 anti-sigma factor [Comamonas testosteroni]
MNDDLIKREQLSALVDGESESLHMQAVLSFAESDEGQQSWRMYHLIGDVLRSPELAHHSRHDVLSGVRAHMEREPLNPNIQQALRGIELPGITGELEQVAAADDGKLRANGAKVVSMPARQAANASVFRWKMAAGFASVAAVAAVGWGVMVAGGGFSGRQGTQLAALTPSAVMASAPAAAAPAAVNSLASLQVAAPEASMPLGAQAQSSTAVAVSGPNGQTVMLRDSRLDELLAAHPQYSSAPNLQMPASFLRNASFGSATRH